MEHDWSLNHMCDVVNDTPKRQLEYIVSAFWYSDETRRTAIITGAQTAASLSERDRKVIRFTPKNASMNRRSHER